MSDPLYQQLLGPAWAELSPSVRGAHAVESQLESAGSFDITHFQGWLARRAGMPPPGRSVPTNLRIIRRGDKEEWSRTFGQFPLNSIQYARDGLLGERFGRMEFWCKLEVRDGGICFLQRRAAICFGRRSLPLPVWVSPQVVGTEMPGRTADETRVCVSVSLRLIGKIFEYQGLMKIAEAVQ